MSTNLITIDVLENYEDGDLVRIEFENRTAWNATIAIVDEDPDDHRHTTILRWIDYKKGPANDRDFVLDQNEDGHVICETKPAWGRMTRIKTRQAR